MPQEVDRKGVEQKGMGSGPHHRQGKGVGAEIEITRYLIQAAGRRY
jgi:hypothetical protein